jgi:cysteinyl-tRNA synthetase
MGFFSFFKKPGKSLPQLQFHNTLSGQLETFEPLSKKEVKMYNCGPTVYAEQHIGNLRGPILANTVKRALNLWGYKVSHVSNITDVGHLVSDADDGEDKVEASAKKLGITAQEIAEDITKKFFADLDLLGIDRRKMRFTRATDYIHEQIALVQSLFEKGYAYEISDGIYFDTAKFKDYGKLGALDLAGERAGARVEENHEKKNSHDFALWKFSPKGEKRQQEWPSPWGVGFPGWHIECTAMIFKTLGKQIDIHMGGIDLAPIHHNNEIAQAEATTHKQFAKYWMHNAFITIESKKISKSLGNTVYLHNIVDRGYSPLALRYWYLTGHYRSPMNFTWEAIEGADQALKRLTRAYLQLSETKHLSSQKSSGNSMLGRNASYEEMRTSREFSEDFHNALAHDLDTPKALARVWELVKNESISAESKKKSLELVDRVFGLGFTEKRETAKIQVLSKKELPVKIQELLNMRETARKEKDFAKADEVRKEIEDTGYEIKDTSEGPELTKK